MSHLRIKTCVVGNVSTNCYILYREDTREAVVVDPGDQAEYLAGQCQAMRVEVKAILLTHGHHDHILAVNQLKKTWNCNIYAGAKEEALLKDPSLNLSGLRGVGQIRVEADVLLQDGAALEFLGWDWKVIATPGHTAGCVCYWIQEEETLLSGDTLFAESLGRTDLPTSNSRAIIQSISEKLFVLPEETRVYPGHGQPTTIGHEKQYNPVADYLRRR